MIAFSDLKPNTNLIGYHDEAYRIFFPNGYGASVIKGKNSYGGPEGFYELAALAGDETKAKITYDVPFGEGDVVGWLTRTQVEELLNTLANLPNRAQE